MGERYIAPSEGGKTLAKINLKNSDFTLRIEFKERKAIIRAKDKDGEIVLSIRQSETEGTLQIFED